MSVILSDYFSGIAAKRLARVEIVSNQHEFNGINSFRHILGNERRTYAGRVIYFTDEEDSLVDNASNFTWYDVRERNPNRSPEFRLYFSDNVIVPNANVEDLVIMAKGVDDQLVVIVAAAGTTAEKQLLYLFGLSEVQHRFVVADYRAEHVDVGFAGKYILDLLGVKVNSTISEDDYLQLMLENFGKQFPSTARFSAFARSTVQDVNVFDDPDYALISWWDREGELLRIFERAIVSEKIREGFGDDVEAFVQFALSVINRRKSRAGHSFENHLQTIFDTFNLTYTKGGKTERNNRPDFVFPSINAYRDITFPADSLTMLGVKTTAKDRWRQVLAEADRITNKHLITLEPAISKNQTDEMRVQNLQLVIPRPLHNTFLASQQEEIIDLKAFVDFIR